MKRLTRGLAATALFAAVLALGAAPAARAQPPHRFPGPPPQGFPGPPPHGFPEHPPPQQGAVPGDGTELFRALLALKGIQPAHPNELLGPQPLDSDVIVIVIGAGGQEFMRTQPLDWARHAIQFNGAALIAPDSRSDHRIALHDAHAVEPRAPPTAWFNGGPVTVQNEADGHHKRPDCPYVVPVSPDELRVRPNDLGRVWGVFRGLTRLATNRPTYIEELREYRGEYQYQLARLPKSATRRGGSRPPLFAVGGDGPDGPDGPGYAFLAVASDGLFINQMLVEPGTDNLEFALRTIAYLQGPGQHRKRCLFFENGRVVDKFDTLSAAVAKPRPKVPPEAMPSLGPLFGKNQEAIVKGIDKFADKAQTDDWLHQTKVGPSGSEQERAAVARWTEAAVILGAVAITLFLLRRSLSARHPLDVPPAPVTGAGAAATGPPGVFDRRQRELVRRNNLYEPVRTLMREFFDAAGAPPSPGPRLPPIEISDAVRKPGSLGQALRDMWRIAYGPPTHISAQRWFELEPYFERLRQAHADGKWRFLTDET